MTTRDWLLANGYEEVANLIDEIMAELRAKGSKQRRNRWDVLAGSKDGRPVTVSGREFPVLKVAQCRQGKTITPNAISRHTDEQPPNSRFGRWASQPSNRPRRKTSDRKSTDN